MHTILYTFSRPEDRDAFAELVSIAVHLSSTHPEHQLDAFIEAVKTSVLDPEVRGINESNSRVYVGNMMVYEGLHKDAVARFESEVATHSAKVELRSYKQGKWVAVRSRR